MPSTSSLPRPSSRPPRRPGERVGASFFPRGSHASLPTARRVCRAPDRAARGVGGARPQGQQDPASEGVQAGQAQAAARDPGRQAEAGGVGPDQARPRAARGREEERSGAQGGVDASAVRGSRDEPAGQAGQRGERRRGDQGRAEAGPRRLQAHGEQAGQGHDGLEEGPLGARSQEVTRLRRPPACAPAPRPPLAGASGAASRG